jgi:hypothetical protein
MKMRELRACDACKRGTRDWHTVTLTIDGRKAVEVVIDQRCSSDVEDAVRRALREAAPVHA